jgi:hypothetical protein
MGITPHLAQKHIEDAARIASATHEKLEQEAGEHIKSYERFYNTLAVVSGGTIALSVTYLGYLKNLDRPVLLDQLLVGSWICLFVALVSGIFTPFFHTHYVHYARIREFAQRKGAQREAEAEALDHLPIVNVRTPSEREELRARFTKAAQSFSKDEKWAARREDFYMYVWVWLGRTARLMFVGGLGLLLSFAVRNI